MVLPLLLGALAPGLLAPLGIGAVAAGALGAGVGGAIQTGDLESGIITGLGAFAGGHLLGPMLSGAGVGAAPAVAPGVSSLAPTTSPLPMPRPANLMASAAAPQASGIMGLKNMGAGLKSMGADAIKFAKSPAGMGAGIGATMGQAVAPGILSALKGDEKKENENYVGGVAMPRPLVMPGADYQAGKAGEHNYGLGTPYTAGQVRAYAKDGTLPYARGGRVRPQHPAVQFRLAEGGVIPRGGAMVRLAGGGVVALASGGKAEAPDQNDRQIISAAIAAVRNQHPEPELALGQFLSRFGERALRTLVDKVKSGEMADTAARFAAGENGEVRGPGDGSGTDDMVPAQMADGSGDVLLSDGEYVLRKSAADSLGEEFGEEFLDKVNRAGPDAGRIAKKEVRA